MLFEERERGHRGIMAESVILAKTIIGEGCTARLGGAQGGQRWIGACQLIKGRPTGASLVNSIAYDNTQRGYMMLYGYTKTCTGDRTRDRRIPPFAAKDATS